MSDNEFLDPSPVVLSRPKTHFFLKKRYLPFDRVPVGKSFKVIKGDNLEANEVPNIQVLRTTASRESKRLQKLFRVCEHKELGCFEVYCYDVIEPGQQVVSTRGRPRKKTVFTEAANVPVGNQEEPEPIQPKPLKDWITVQCPSCGEETGSLPPEEFTRPIEGDLINVEVLCPCCDSVTVQPRAQFEE